MRTTSIHPLTSKTLRAALSSAVYGLLTGLVILGALAVGYGRLDAAGIDALPSLVVGVIGGAVGAMASIVLRSSTLNLAPYAHWQLEAIQGAVLIILGAVFGFILVAAVRGEIVLSFLDGKPYGLLVFSILAGFSEKYVPEILAGMERRPTENPAELRRDARLP